jgi:hypothetical protein
VGKVVGRLRALAAEEVARLGRGGGVARRRWAELGFRWRAARVPAVAGGGGHLRGKGKKEAAAGMVRSRRSSTTATAELRRDPTAPAAVCGGRRGDNR